MLEKSLPTAQLPNPSGDVATVTSEAFLSAMRHAVTAVSIVTTNGETGELGITASAFSSVSAEPPLVLVCIKRQSQIEGMIRRNGVFCINVLSAGQSELANAFAGRSEIIEPYDFSAAQWTLGITGARRLMGATASFECEMYNAIEAGTHSILIGRVIGLLASEEIPLAYQNRAYRRPAPL